MVQIKKCRSVRHHLGGCGDPRCPEGLSIKAAMKEAVDNKDVAAFLKARALLDGKPTALFVDKGFNSLYVQNRETKEETQVRFVASRPEIAKAVNEALDRTVFPSFETIDELTSYINDAYRPYARLQVYDYEDEVKGFKRLSVASMHVDADLRSQGIGKYMRKLLCKFADEKGYILTGTPTNSGDGSIEHTNDNEEEFKAHAIAHRNRLIKFYLDNGYEYNYAYIPVDYSRGDYWTKEPYPENQEWVDKLNPDAQKFLSQSGFYIRWPNGEIPKNMLAKKRRSKPTSS